jgi:hypothetical protein
MKSTKRQLKHTIRILNLIETKKEWYERKFKNIHVYSNKPLTEEQRKCLLDHGWTESDGSSQ